MYFIKSFKNYVKDIVVDLAEEFDCNHKRNGFVRKAWNVAKRNDPSSLLVLSGNLLK